jgi:hypothetical protein
MRHYDGTYRSTREAFAAERWPAMEGPYRPPLRWLPAVGCMCVLGLFAGIGVMLAWRG